MKLRDINWMIYDSNMANHPKQINVRIEQNTVKTVFNHQGGEAIYTHLDQVIEPVPMWKSMWK